MQQQQFSKSVKIIFGLIFMGMMWTQAQTRGINYQALILNSDRIQIPGTNVLENQIPLALEEATFRFTIIRETINGN